MNNELNMRQKLFCDLYTDIDSDIYGNATQCYLKAYSDQDYYTAGVSAHELLKNPKVKAYIDNKRETVSEYLANKSMNLIKHAWELSMGLTDKGNTAVLNKLLDKIAPTLNSNANTNTELNSDDYISNIVSNLLNSVNNSDNKAHIPADDNKPLVKSSNNNNLENN